MTDSNKKNGKEKSIRKVFGGWAKTVSGYKNKDKVVHKTNDPVQGEGSGGRGKEVPIERPRRSAEDKVSQADPRAPAAVSLWDTAWEKVKLGEYGEYVAQYESVILRDKYPADGAGKHGLRPLPSDDRAKRMQAVVDEQAEKLRQARWGFVMSGRKIEVADLVERIVDGVLYVKDFVGKVVKESGEPHAALAWAGVCLLLPLVMNSTLQRRAAVVLLERITDIAARYRVREEAFLGPESASKNSQAVQDLRTNFQKKTVDLYQDILVAQILLARAYARSSFLRYGRNIVKWDPWEALEQSLYKKDEAITLMVNDLEQQQVGSSLSDIKELIDQAKTMWLTHQEAAKAEAVSAVQLQQEQENRSCLQTLSSLLDYETCKNQVATRVPETLRWFFEDMESFISWRDCKESRTLIVYAGAGCCKSVMMRAAVDEELSSNTGRITCYFFFRRGNVLQESVSEALNALLHQIISQAPHLIHLVVAEYQKEGNNLSAKVEVLWRIICQCSSTYEGEIICILDALDECAKTNNSGRVGEDRAFVPRNFLVDKLQSLWDKNAAETRPTIGRLKFLVTIRSDVNVGFDKMTMSNASSDQLCQLNKEWIVPRTDMVAFVKYKVERLAQTEEVQRQLKQQLLEKQGKSTSFLWLSLIIEAINTEDELQEQSAENLNKFLNGDVPDTVNGAYEALLPAKKDRQKTRGVFNIMLAARTPLTVPQINQALKFVLDENVRPGSNLALQKDAAFEATLASYCGALISIMPSGKDRVVTFFHSTAREFLLEPLTDNAAASDADGGENRETAVQHAPKLKHTFNLTESNAVLRKSCIKFLRWRGTSDVDANVFNWSRPDIYNGLMQYISGFTSNQPFMAYAAVNWINHLPFETTDVQVRSQVQKEISVLCDISSPVFRTWFLCCWVLWWPESELDDFFRQYLAGWIADHFYPEVEVVECFDLDVWEIEESEKWWKWTISAPPDVWKDMLRVCKPPRDDRRGVQFIPIMATRPLAAF